MTNSTLSVSAIKHGTVIDHIAAGQAMRIIQLLSLHTNQQTVTIGLQLPSKRLGKKDIIKIEQRILTEQEANDIAVFAPLATINIIENFNVTKKINTQLPERMMGVFACRNAACITNQEPVTTHFLISAKNRHVQLCCYYCEKMIDRDDAKVIIE